MGGFEGSFLGKNMRILPDSVLECGVCWWVYDPGIGDKTWQIPPGTAFSELPDHWRCPSCDSAREQFMVLRAGVKKATHAAPGAVSGLQELHRRQEQLTDFYEAAVERMRKLPVFNENLDVQVRGLRRCEQGIAGMVITPWCMNIILFQPEGTHPRMEGTTREVEFPSGSYTFTSARLQGIGAVETCSLFSPMEEFSDNDTAAEVADHAISALFNPPQAAQDSPRLSRRGFLGGNSGHDHTGS